MTLCLYNNLGNGKYENIFAWVPDEPQWWITGFNPAFPDPDYRIMTLVGSIDFSSKIDICNNIKDTYYVREACDIMFDDKNHTIWITW